MNVTKRDFVIKIYGRNCEHLKNYDLDVVYDTIKQNAPSEMYKLTLSLNIERDLKIIADRYEHNMTFKKISEKYHISEGRVRQIEQSVLRILRCSKTIKELHEGLYKDIYER